MTTTLQISKAQARRFMVAHQRLAPPRTLKGKKGVLELLDHLGCIQFDTVNVVGGNPDLVLQSRIAGYTPDLLQEMLYEDRTLVDGWDKQASIVLTRDWPFFSRRRQAMRDQFGKDLGPKGKLAVAAKVREAIQARGPLSSIDIDHEEQIDWSWGATTRAVTASMEALYKSGDLGIHHRVHTRRVFDLIENLLPADLLDAPDPHPDEEAYVDAHILRRMGSMGIASQKAGEYWYGLRGTYGGVSAKERNAALASLLERGAIVEVKIEGIAKPKYYVRAEDVPALEAAAKELRGTAGAAFIAPLDTLIWQRDAVEHIFDFYYRWEVYVPADKREYGYYVLPVLYGDRFVGRMDPEFDRKTNKLTIRGWWWEEGVDSKDEAMLSALKECLAEFGRYLGATEIVPGKAVKKMDEMKKILP